MCRIQWREVVFVVAVPFTVRAASAACDIKVKRIVTGHQ